MLTRDAAFAVLGLLILTCGLTGLIGTLSLPTILVGGLLALAGGSRYGASHRNRPFVNLCLGLLLLAIPLTLLLLLDLQSAVIDWKLFSRTGAYMMLGVLMFGAVLYVFIQGVWLLLRIVAGTPPVPMIDHMAGITVLWMVPLSPMVGALADFWFNRDVSGVLLVGCSLVLGVILGAALASSRANRQRDGQPANPAG